MGEERRITIDWSFPPPAMPTLPAPPVRPVSASPPGALVAPEGAAEHENAGVVLVANEDPAERNLLARWLVSGSMSVMPAVSGAQALELAKTKADEIDAIIFDAKMPDIDGYAALAELRANDGTATIPVVLLTAHATDGVDILRTLRAGGVDHICKPFRGSVLTAKLATLCAIRRNERTLRERLQIAEANATTDPLTGLPNRTSFETRIVEEADYARRMKTPLGLVLADIDRFEPINDRFGRQQGDRVLLHVAALLRPALRKYDVAFRVGGDEVALLLRSTDAVGAQVVAERLRQALRSEPIDLGPGSEQTITLSAGVAAADEPRQFSALDLFARADAALRQAKRDGRDRVCTAE
jgi:two-component system, cell cycle response regulator